MLISSFQANNTCREAIAVGAIILGHQIRGDLTDKRKQGKWLLVCKNERAGEILSDCTRCN